jgi:hypothetical protein
MDSHGYIVSRMGFCRAIAMIAKLNERNTFVVSNPARGAEPLFAGARAAAGAAAGLKSLS